MSYAAVRLPRFIRLYVGMRVGEIKGAEEKLEEAGRN